MKTRSPYDDHKRPLNRALYFGLHALVIVTIVLLMVWGAVSGLPGLWGVLVGSGIGGAFMLLTVINVLITASSSPSTTGVVILGGWLVKLIVAGIVLYSVRDAEFYDPVALFSSVVAVCIVVIGAEVYGIMTTNVTYITPQDTP
ncbi:hypothetical protein N7326_05430 [Corynebacterium sp. ES2794-CONJ1]|uniref:hypothetical protein n=1 Tax=unclassified Corynebacterium TaxID=2624378 RepID=UPI0021689696|nr:MULTISPECIES: hypothetical protein [unclassified Corynebacterium]MCS4489826.1 hypothetical protein [Corynebacterium sp. ES2775-CONJ]MCS4491810.1 hypothetical protein [Corynebacterium sp. ES2715-CONJ3]MCS4531915.1 hypothetical protein [Corynebacterium sp. ES2730-CONJ]MCU9519316.1 hypothetical protein [Corynebacterium sp. ES2794-CONJ1]